MVRIKKPTEDGLDPVYLAYLLLKRVFEQAEREEVYDDHGEFYGEYLVLPGDIGAFDANDSNPLLELEEWLVERGMGDIE